MKEKKLPPFERQLAWYKRLRWRLVGIPFIVVVVSVVNMVVGMQWVTTVYLPPRVLALWSETSPPSAEQLAQLLQLLRQVVLSVVTVVATIAILFGSVTSMWLWSILVAPLRSIASSMRRIIEGRYQERVTVPENAGEAITEVVTHFNQMVATLEEIEAKRMTMIANVTHELRTPLTGLKGYVEGLEDGIFSADPPTLHQMGQEIGRLTRLVDDIQLLSRIEAQAITLNRQRFDLSDTVQQIITQLQPTFHAKQQQITFTPAPTPYWVYADSDRTTQILTNLLGNAQQYTPEQGHIALSLHREKETTAVMVCDDGCGIAAENLPYLFERFYRVEPSRSRQSGGSGIGLTISRHLARQMGGELQVKSGGLGQGSCFTLTLLNTPPNTERSLRNHYTILL